MDLFRTLKDLVVEEGSEPDKKPAPTTPSKQVAVTGGTSVPRPESGGSFLFGVARPVAPPMAAVAPDPDLVRRLEARLQTGMPPVYVQFLQQYETLRDVIPDETTLFRAALKSSHCSIEQLTQALDQLLSILATAEEEFNKGFEANKTSALDGIRKSMASVNKGIDDRHAQIQSIQQEVTQLVEQGRNLDSNMRDEEQRFMTLRLGFSTALDTVRKKLESQKAHLTQQKV